MNPSGSIIDHENPTDKVLEFKSKHFIKKNEMIAEELMELVDKNFDDDDDFASNPKTNNFYNNF